MCETKTLNFRKTCIYMVATISSQVLYQTGLLFTLERYISVRLLYWTGIRMLSMVIRKDMIRYDSVY